MREPKEMTSRTVASKKKVKGTQPKSRKKRTRRKGTETRQLILSAATELFSAHGYAGTTTRKIADHANANEVLIFRYFGSKADLFRQAIVEPLSNFISSYAQASRQPPAQRSHAYTSLLWEMLTKRRAMFMALITAAHYNVDGITGLEEIPEMLEYFEAAKKTLVSSRGAFNMDPELAVRLPFCLVLGMVLFNDWLFVGPGDFPREELIEAAAKMMISGVIGRPPEA
jgi:AcrR family transcriptional regulator